MMKKSAIAARAERRTPSAIACAIHGTSCTAMRASGPLATEPAATTSS